MADGQSGALPDRDRELWDSRLRRLYDYWDELRGEWLAPPRGAIEPFDLKFLLGRLAIVEVGQGASASAYRFRLMGTRLAEQDGIDLTGKTLDAHPMSEHRETAREHYDEVVRRQTPLYREVEWTHARRTRRHGRLVLPLSEDGAAVDGLLIGRVELLGGG